MAVDAIRARASGTFLKRWLRFIARAALALLAIWILHLSQNRFDSFQLNYSSTFRWDGGLWLGWVGTLAAAGFLFGLAVFLPFSRVRFRWNRLLLATLALLPVFQDWLVWGYLVPRRDTVGGWLVTTNRWFEGVGTQSALMVLAGVAIASGFGAKNVELSGKHVVSGGLDSADKAQTRDRDTTTAPV